MVKPPSFFPLGKIIYLENPGSIPGPANMFVEIITSEGIVMIDLSFVLVAWSPISIERDDDGPPFKIMLSDGHSDPFNFYFNTFDKAEDAFQKIRNKIRESKTVQQL